MLTSRWTAHYEPGIPHRLPPLEGAFWGLAEAAAAAAPSLPALEFYGRRWNYAELNARAGHVAAALQRDGLQPGEGVVLALPNGAHFAIAALGILRAGGVVVPLSAESDLPFDVSGMFGANLTLRMAIATPEALLRLPAGMPCVAVPPEESLPRFLRWVYALRGKRGSPDRSDPDVAVNGRDAGWQPAMGSVKSAPNGVAGSIDRDSRSADSRRAGGPRGPVRWSRWLAAAGTPEEVPATADDLALLIPGIDGRPPQRFTHRHLLAGSHQLQAWLTDAVPGDDTWLILCPMATAFGFVLGLGTVPALRDRLVMVPGRSSHEILEALRFLRPAYVVADRRTVRLIADDPALARGDLRSVRVWLTGDVWEPALAEAFAETTGDELCQGLALPGAAGLVACNPVNGRRVAGSVGLPLPEVCVDLLGQVEDLARLPEAGPIGPLRFAGPNVAHAANVARAAAIPAAPEGRGAGREGWMDSGLAGFMDGAGYLYVVAP